MSYNVLDEYIKNVKREIPQNYKNRKKFIASVSCDLEEYLEKNSNATYEELCAEFGHPYELVGGLFDNFDSHQVKEVFSKQYHAKKVQYALIGIIVGFVLFFCMYLPHIGVGITETIYIYETENS